MKPLLTKIFIIADVPPEHEQAWLQHVRDFDTGHRGCHFEIAVEAPHRSLAEAIQMMHLDPELTFTNFFGKKVS